MTRASLYAGCAAELLLVIWFLAALIVGASGVFYKAPAPVGGGTIWGLTALLLLAFWLVKSFREWLLDLPLRALLWFHVIRLPIGAAFLVYNSKGVLPAAFAVPAGRGDIAVAIGALIIIRLGLPIRNKLRWWVLMVWNALGLTDILLVVARGMRLALADINSMAAGTELPLSLLPTFIVPLIMASHVVIFAGAIRSRRRASSLQSMGQATSEMTVFSRDARESGADEPFEERYLDVLQNIEFALVSVYKRQPNLTDHGALYAVETLIKVYRAESQGRTAALPQFQPQELEAYNALKSMCDWRLGRGALKYARGKGEMAMEFTVTVDEIIACLNRIQRSIKFWQKRGGRRGYFEYASQFVK